MLLIVHLTIGLISNTNLDWPSSGPGADESWSRLDSLNVAILLLSRSCVKWQNLVKVKPGHSNMVRHMDQKRWSNRIPARLTFPPPPMKGSVFLSY